MDPNNSQDASDSPNIQKLEDDLKKLSDEAVRSNPQTIPEPLAAIQPPVVNDVPFGTPPQVPKKNSSLLAIAGILMFFSVAALAAYFLIPKYFGVTSTPKACTAEAMICPDGSSVGRTGPNCEFAACPEVTAAPDPTADWKTYTNTKYLYSLKYPQSFTVGQNGMNSPTPETVEDVIVYELNKAAADGPALSVSILQKGSISLESNAQTHFNKISKYVLTPDPTFPTYKSNSVVSGITKSTFLNKSAFTYMITGSYYDDLATEAISSPIDRKYIWVDNGSNFFLIRIDKDTQMDQILSTFKFSEATPSGSPTGSPSSLPIY